MQSIKRFAAKKQLGAVIYLKSAADAKAWNVYPSVAPCWALAQNGHIVALGEDNIKKHLGIS